MRPSLCPDYIPPQRKELTTRLSVSATRTTDRDGFDRDEYPPAVGRGKGEGLERGRNPRGWKADVRYVESHETNRTAQVLGIKLRRFCDATRFCYVFH